MRIWRCRVASGRRGNGRGGERCVGGRRGRRIGARFENQIAESDGSHTTGDTATGTGLLQCLLLRLRQRLLVGGGRRRRQVIRVRVRQIAGRVERSNIGQQGVELGARNLLDDARVPQGKRVRPDQTLGIVKRMTRVGVRGGEKRWAGKGTRENVNLREIR